jgi:hypothetical protein
MATHNRLRVGLALFLSRAIWKLRPLVFHKCQNIKVKQLYPIFQIEAQIAKDRGEKTIEI